MMTVHSAVLLRSRIATDYYFSDGYRISVWWCVYCFFLQTCRPDGV